MIRSSCVHCGASLWRGIERDIGQALVDVAPLTVTEETELLWESIQTDGWRRKRISYDILTTEGRDSPVIEARRAWKPARPRGYVVISHRCGRAPARRLPFFPEGSGVIEAATPDEPPFFPQPGASVFSPGDNPESGSPPYADVFSPAEPDEVPRALAVLVIAYGQCPLCSLLNPANDKGIRKQGLCSSCRGFAHGGIYDTRNTPVIGWCEVSSHRRRTATRNTSGQWDCGRHRDTSAWWGRRVTLRGLG